MKRIFTAALFAALFANSLFAGKIRTVTVSAPAHYDKAAFQQAVVSSDGAVRLARWLKPLATEGTFDAARVWDVVEDKSGNLFAASGDAGKVYKVSPAGAVTVAYESKDSQILCLILAGGSVSAGTGPSGLIVQIDPSGNARLFSETRESYVWALGYDEGSKTLYAATGPHGRILRINADGKGETLFQCKQDHILS